uniref:Uncharacterized protein n=1 Tax=viral metagenome TaxID=1070528 RepID=A0A6H1ZAV4_9ZZZZ
MGVYDTIIFHCPNCGVTLDAQSKSGACLLEEYTLENVPFEVALNANRHAPFNCDCGKSWELDMNWAGLKVIPAKKIK